MIANPPSRPRRANAPKPEQLPPHDVDAEMACLGAVMLSTKSQQEVEALLIQMRPALFFDLKNRTLLEEMVRMKMEGHAIDIWTLQTWLKGRQKLEECGGLAGISALEDKIPSTANFKYHLDIIKEKYQQRLCIAKAAKLYELSQASDFSMEKIKEELAEISEKVTSQASGIVPMINIITPAQARDFQPDPKDYMVGEGLLVRGMMMTIGGEPGIGKSRLATTLAVAGARGSGNWMGYPVRSKWKSLILQSENSGSRLQEEYMAVPKSMDDYIRTVDGLSHGMAFDNPEFRRELRRFYDSWPFQMMVIDPWNDVSFEEGQRDYKQALLYIKSVFNGVKCPSIVIVAHLRKRGRDDGGKRKTGRELLHELSGSLALGSSSRTVCVVQSVSPGMDDPRIVFELAKANDAKPEWLREVGVRSAWNRANGAFESIQLNWDDYENPGKPDRRAISLEMLIEAFKGRPGMKRSELKKKLMEVGEAQGKDMSEATVYRAIKKDGYLARYIYEVAGVCALQNVTNETDEDNEQEEEE